jgi:hypothetical protein
MFGFVVLVDRQLKSMGDPDFAGRIAVLPAFSFFDNPL